MSAHPGPTHRSIAHYDLLERVGEGGMGTVYRAHDRTLDRTVALKFLHDKFLESVSGKARFLQEARALSRLSHPHIAIIHSIEECDGETFLVFEYLPGGALRSLLGSMKADGKRLCAEQAATYALQIAEGLAHAHASGIIHRDVKPGNVMFARDGSLKLVDFGLSKLHGTDTSTMSGRVMGTPQYMSPEQAQGKEIDERSDIFSLGVVLYEMVAGQPPFTADRSEAVIHQIVHEPAAPMSEKNPECPPQLADIIHRALNKNREARYQRVIDLATDLRAFLRAYPAASEIRTRTMVASRPALRRRTIFAVLSLVIVVTALFLTPLRNWLWQPLPAEKRLAILPFVNEGNDPASQAFGDGLMESAIAALQDMQPNLVVTPAGEIRRLAIKSPEAARKLAGANLVIGGKIRRIGENVNVELDLVDPRKPQHLASAHIAYASDQPESIQKQMRASLVKLLHLKVTRNERDDASSLPAANEAYLEGTGYLHRFDIAGNLDKAIAALNRAVERDPHLSSAYVGLSEAYGRRYRDTKDPQFLDRARESAAKAIELNSSSASAHWASGVVLSLGGDQEGAIREFERTLALDPLHADAIRDLATAYDAFGRISEAEATYRKAVELRRNDWVTLADLGSFHFRHQKYDEAEKDFRAVIALVPDSQLQHRNLGGVYIEMGRFADAERELLKSIELAATPSAYSNLGALYIYLGRYPDAIVVLNKAIQLPSAQLATNYKVWGNLGDAYRYTPDQAAKARGAYETAIGKVEQQLAFDPDNAQLLADMAAYAAKMGNRGQALDAIGRAMRFAHGNRKVSFQASLVYELGGARERALAALGDAIRGGYSLNDIAHEPELAKLRQDPRYQQLLTAQSRQNSRK